MAPRSFLRNQYKIASSNQYLTAYVLIGFWVLSMISLPITRWIWGDLIIPYSVNLSAVLQTSAVFMLLAQRWGIRRTSITFLVVAIITWGTEFIGSTTGFPFGEYDYTSVLQPQIAHVPLLIPAAWFMMLPPAWAVAQVIAGNEHRTWQKHGMFIIFSALAITAWDLFLDPQMVGWEFWVWENPSGYFGIPWINYFGWILTAAIVTLVVQPKSVPINPLILIYGIVWFLQSFGQFFFWNQPGPAIVGFLAMGSLLVLAVYRLYHQSMQ